MQENDTVSVQHSTRERLTSAHLFALAVCAFGFLFDLWEIALGSALGAIYASAPQAATPSQLSWLLSSVYIGAVVGPPALGYIADRCGRRPILSGTLALLAFTSLLAACAVNLRWLIIWRTLSGLALGAYPPIMTTYLTDILPPRRRGASILAAIAVAWIGAPSGLFLVRWLTPLRPMGIDGWRWAFLLGGIGAAAAAVLFFAVPESRRWPTTDTLARPVGPTAREISPRATLLRRPSGCRRKYRIYRPA